MNDAVDAYLADLAGCLTFHGRRRSRVLREVRDHLDDAFAARRSAMREPGAAHEQAAREQAVRAFGAPADLARQFNAEAATIAMRRTPVLVAASAATVIGGFLLAATTQPQPALPSSASIVLRVTYFAAVVGVQVAFVAGARAASLVAARRRSSPTSGADRVLVWRGAVVCVGGLAAAALGWTVALALAVHGRPHVRVPTVAAGSIVMIGAALTAVTALLRQPRPVGDDASGDGLEPAPDAQGVVLGLGEVAIGWVRRRPVITCATTAIVGALLAMSAAETTVVGALPTGIAQAAAVVAGFVVLGPYLGLRTKAAVS